jgi:hypothetical protein
MVKLPQDVQNIMWVLKKLTPLALALVFFSYAPISAYAATSPGLGQADTFSVLSSTYTNTASGTTLNGDLGYTTPPATAPTVNGDTHSADSTYAQAGLDQDAALITLGNQICTFSFSPGAIDLATDTTHGPVGVYTPGVYCIDGAASIGGGGTITLDGAGTYIFWMTGALNTSANSVVTLANGASPCAVWWAPAAATTLGANSTFAGTDIDASGITIGSNVTWVGRALAFGGTVTTDSDTISTSACVTPDDDTPDGSGSGGTSGSGTGSGAASGLAGTGQNAGVFLAAGSALIMAGAVALGRKFKT